MFEVMSVEYDSACRDDREHSASEDEVDDVPAVVELRSVSAAPAVRSDSCCTFWLGLSCSQQLLWCFTISGDRLTE